MLIWFPFFWFRRGSHRCTSLDNPETDKETEQKAQKKESIYIGDHATEMTVDEKEKEEHQKVHWKIKR